MAWSDVIDFGEWLPDQPNLAGPALRTAMNVVPRARGYDMWPTLTDASRGSLDTFCRGAIASRSRQGTDFIAAGTTAKLWLATTGVLADVTRSVGGAYASTTRWAFALHGDDIVAVNYDDTPQLYTLGTSATFGALHADAPRARYAAVVREFLVLGNIVGRGVHAAIYGTREDGIHWSAQGNAANWQQAGTSAAAAVQSDWQPIVDHGGEITGLVGGFDYGLVFKKRSVHRLDYEGGDTFFRLTQIDGNRGCYVPDSAIRIGGRTYFLAEDGLYATDGAGPSVPIGEERVNRWLYDTMNLDRLERVCVFVHPTLPLIGWSFMNKSANGDAMNTILLYNHAVNRFTAVTQTSEWYLAAILHAGSIDAAPYAAGNFDTTYASLDLDTLGGSMAERSLAAFTAAHRLDILTGDPVAGALETYDFELSPGQVSFVRAIRPLYKVAGKRAVLVLNGRMKSGAGLSGGVLTEEDDEGKFNTRRSARYHSAYLALYGAYEGVHGLAADVVAEGMR